MRPNIPNRVSSRRRRADSEKHVFRLPKSVSRLNPRSASAPTDGKGLEFDQIKEAILSEAKSQMEKFTQQLLAGLTEKIEALRPSSDC